jgi:hypothetical protein
VVFGGLGFFGRLHFFLLGEGRFFGIALGVHRKTVGCARSLLLDLLYSCEHQWPAIHHHIINNIACCATRRASDETRFSVPHWQVRILSSDRNGTSCSLDGAVGDGRSTGLLQAQRTVS